MKAKIHVVTSILLDEQTHSDLKKEIEQKLKPAQTLCEKEGIPFDFHLSVGELDAADDLIAFAKENQVDLIYIGLHKRSKLGKFILGSTAQDLLLKAEFPMVITKIDKS